MPSCSYYAYNYLCYCMYLVLTLATHNAPTCHVPTSLLYLASNQTHNYVPGCLYLPTGTATTACSYVNDPHLHVVDSSQQDRNLVLLYHSSSGTHSIWRATPTSNEVCSNLVVTYLGHFYFPLSLKRAPTYPLTQVLKEGGGPVFC